ncbi:MAG: thiamine-phosphate kinase [Burkholderiales bacterium]
MSEFDIIRRYFTHAAPQATLGVGDDAAIVRPRAGYELAISVDMLLEGRHFFPGADPERLGHKTLAVNLSDLAAMGATPRWATLAVALPRVDTRWLAAFSRGFFALARRHRVDLIGGDTTRGPLTLCVQVMGEVPRGQALRRDGARLDDDVWVSGQIGGAAMALEVIAGRMRVPASARRALEARLHAPTPRLALGLRLRRIAHSAIDVSDGLLADLGHICERSRVAARVHWEAFPATPLVRALAQSERGAQALLAGGDDYELCFTAPRRRRAAVVAAAVKARTPVMLIGTIVRRQRGQPLVQVLDSVGKPLTVRRKGFDHFG